jgi:predicted nucleic acid-binding protein
MAESKQSGAVLSVKDAFFAAAALVHGLTLATRNTKTLRRLASRSSIRGKVEAERGAAEV